MAVYESGHLTNNLQRITKKNEWTDCYVRMSGRIEFLYCVIQGLRIITVSVILWYSS